jgi:hypothetical protein
METYDIQLERQKALARIAERARKQDKIKKIRKIALSILVVLSALFALFAAIEFQMAKPVSPPFNFRPL